MTTILAQEGVPYRERCTITIPGVTALTTGYSAAMVIASGGVLVLALSEGDGLTTTPDVDQVFIDIELTAVQMAELNLRSYDFSLDLLLNDVVEMRPLRGRFVAEQDVVEG